MGCYEFRTFNLSDPFSVSFGNIVPPTCIGDSNGTASLSSAGCPCMVSTCTFLWDNGVTTKPNLYLPEGWSSVMVTYANGCVVVDSVFIPSSSPVIDTVLFENIDLCSGFSSGSAIALYDQATMPVALYWSNGETNDTILDLSEGSYYILAQD